MRDVRTRVKAAGTAGARATGVLAGAVWVLVAPSAARAEDEVPSSIEFAPDDPTDNPQPAPLPSVAPPADAKDAKTPAGAPPLLHSRRKYDTKDEVAKPAAEDPVKTKAREAVFGTYRVRIGYGIPKFSDLRLYNQAYGSPKGFPELGVDWFAWDWYATLGIGLRMGYYNASGSALQVNDGVTKTDPRTFTADDVHKDANGSTALTLIPLKLVATAELTPFTRKWVVVDGWAGYERLYYQEVRRVAAVTTPTTTPTTTSTSGSGTKAAPVDGSLVNRGWVNATVVGAAINLLLNPIDEQSSYAAHTGMGIGSIYLTGFAEWIRSIDRSQISFGRSVYGIAFTFETSQ